MSQDYPAKVVQAERYGKVKTRGQDDGEGKYLCVTAEDTSKRKGEGLSGAEF